MGAPGAPGAPGVAHAQESRADRTATAAQVPWYERFTFSAAPQEKLPSWSSVNPRDPAAGAASARWGMTVNVGEAEQRLTEAGRITRDNEAAVGAFYRFTPRVRVGGKVSVAPPQSVTPNDRSADKRPPEAGVRLESAFKF
jgi:hypothetical protein